MGKPTHHLDATPPPETACSAAQADSLSGTSAQQERLLPQMVCPLDLGSVLPSTASRLLRLGRL